MSSRPTDRAVGTPTDPPKFDVMERLHGILTRYGIASRSATDWNAGLATELVKWAADACRQSAPAADPVGGNQNRIVQTITAKLDELNKRAAKAAFDVPHQCSDVVWLNNVEDWLDELRDCLPVLVPEGRQPFCHGCQQPIDDEIVWLGETYDGVQKEFPFHLKCADQPWPLYEIRRERVPEGRREDDEPKEEQDSGARMQTGAPTDSLTASTNEPQVTKCKRCYGTGYIPSETCDECPDCQDRCPVCKGTGTDL